MAKEIQDQLTEYLTDAHAIEEQALQQLRTAPEIAGDPEFEEALRRHLHETEEQERRVRALLERRGAAPSDAKDSVLRAGGSGFILFARSQTDTPGKLASHAFSYEALEWASYDLLARTAERAGEPEVADVARSIREEERAMLERLEGLFDRTAGASLRDVVRDDPQDLLRSYLADAHAVEEQSTRLLESGVGLLDAPELRRPFEMHLAQSRRQQDLIEDRLLAAGGERSLLKDAAMRLGGFSWGMFFRGHPDTAGKLMAFAYAFEHLEIAGYEHLRRVAEHAGDPETARTVEAILEEERRTAEGLAATFEDAVGVALRAQEVR